MPRQIHVNGRDYDFVDGGDLTFDEAIVLYDWSKLTMADIQDVEVFHPGLIAGLIHISVARGEPDESAKTIRRMVGKLKYSELNTIFIDVSEEVGELDIPPATAPESGRESSSPPADSGEGSSTPGEPRPASSEGNGSGDPGSATGAISAPRISVG